MTVSSLTRSLMSVLALLIATQACAAQEHEMPDVARKGALYEQVATLQQQPPVTAQKQPPVRPTKADSIATGGKALELAERVWLNSTSKIYHCAGSALYGTTKEGKYVSEKDARAQGNSGARGFICGPTKVWVNTTSSIYHCPGSANYGKTAAGKYMTEPEAKKAKMQAAAGRIC